jgi:hypothetical protein
MDWNIRLAILSFMDLKIRLAAAVFTDWNTGQRWLCPWMERVREQRSWWLQLETDRPTDRQANRNEGWKWYCKDRATAPCCRNMFLYKLDEHQIVKGGGGPGGTTPLGKKKRQIQNKRSASAAVTLTEIIPQMPHRSRFLPFNAPLSARCQFCSDSCTHAWRVPALPSVFRLLMPRPCDNLTPRKANADHLDPRRTVWRLSVPP